MKKLIIPILIVCLFVLSWCSNNSVEKLIILNRDYVWRNAQCQNIQWKITIQSWDYIYVNWTWSYWAWWDEESDSYFNYSWRQFIPECYIETISIEEDLEQTKAFYEWLFQDDKYFACRQHNEMPLQIIHKWKCKERINHWIYYECVLEIDEFSSYPVFCI